MNKKEYRRSSSKLMIASLVLIQVLSGVSPLFTLSAHAEGYTEPTPVVQEITPTPAATPDPTVVPSPTIEPTVLPTVLPTATVEPTALPDPTATPTVEPTTSPEVTQVPINPNEQVCYTNEVVRNTSGSEWIVNSINGTAETKAKLELGVTYVFPLDSKVTVKFNCLPKDESLRTKIRIQQVNVSDLNLPAGTNVSGEYAYDITTGMVNGTFSYDVTLPKPVGQTAEVSYIENVGDALTNIDGSKILQENDTVKINNINHFTVYIITCPTPTGDLKIIKNTIGGNGTFSFVNSGISNFSLTTISGTAHKEFYNLSTTGVYSVNESSTLGWITSYSCDKGTISNIIIESGKTTTCTFTNTKLAKLTLSKTVINDNGGTAVATDWTLKAENSIKTITGKMGESAVTGAYVPAGSFTLSELNGPSGYNSSTWVCSGMASSTDNTVTLNSGQEAICTITNDDIAPTLILNKVVINDNGGTALESAWTLIATGTGTNPTNLSGQGAAGINDVVSGANFKADIYTLSENGSPTGYSASNWTCVKTLGSTTIVGSMGLASVPINSIYLNLNEKATCTITNDDQVAHLTLIKTLTTNYGGPTDPRLWTLTATAGSSSISGKTGDSTITNAGVKADTYALSESGPLGYTSGAWNCIGVQNTGDSITLGNGQSAICTINNVAQPGKLIVKKVIVKSYGGTAKPEDFSFSLSGATAVPFEADAQNDIIVSAGIYSIVESNPGAGYIATYDNCSDVAILNGETKTCTITNYDQPGKLIVRKVLPNDNGGTAKPEDFKFKVNDGSAVYFNSNGQNEIFVNAGIYNVIETNPMTDSYALSYNGCSRISISNGETKICTITNDDIAPRLKIQKTVINDDGGTKTVSDFVLKIDDVSIANNTYRNVMAGIHNVSEVNLPGYLSSVWGGACNPDGSINIKLGESKTCSITNNDIKPNLQVIKVVINDNGGTKKVSDFPLYVSWGSGRTSHKVWVTSGDINGFGAGTYNIGETNDGSGYKATYSGDCVNGKVTLNVGDATKVCTITNDDVQPTLIVKKFVENEFGGTLQSKDFSLHVTVTDNGQMISDFPGSSSGKTLGLNAGSYKVTEDSVSGYKLDYEKACNDDGIINLKVGDVKICELKNHDIQPILKVVKHVINDNGGKMEASDFWFFVDGSHAWPFLFWGREAGTNVGLHAGDYNVEELNTSSKYTTTYSEECNGEIKIGEEKTCTVTNNDNPGTLIVKKIVINDNGGALQPQDFTFKINNGTTDNTFTFESDGQNNIIVDAGRYTVTETTVKEYATSYENCSNVKVVDGGSSTCIVTNNDIAPKLQLVNFNDVNGNQVWDKLDPSTLDQPIQSNEFQLLGTDNSITKTTDSNGTIVFTDFVPGNYQLNNSLWHNWRYTIIDCQSQDPQNLSLQIGDEVVCTFGQQTSALLIKKDNLNPLNNRIGDKVNFIINVLVPEQVSVVGHEEKYNTTDMQDVIVTDIPSFGFTYFSGQMPDTMSENNGVWSLGNIARGNNVDINFKMIIGTTVNPGDYKDIAWAEGSIGNTEFLTSVKQLGESVGFAPIEILALDNPSQTNYFVGTSTEVIKDPVIPEQGVVLGSTTVRLPRTGLDDMTVVIMALALSLFGGTAIILGSIWDKRKKILSRFTNGVSVKSYITAGMFIASIFVFGLLNRSFAQDLNIIKLEQPESPTNSAEINVTYVAYDLSGAALNVQCMVKPVSAVTYSNGFISDPTASSGVCKISHTLIPSDGIYDIQVVNGVKTASVQVEIDRTAPSIPVSYTKTNPGSCQNQIGFVTIVDKDAKTTVDIFRGESTTFVAGPLTILQSVVVNSGDAGVSATFTLPDCSKTYYYAIQAVDSVGNRSSFVGDEGTNVVYYTPSPTPTPIGGVQGSTTGGTENGQNGTGTGTGTGATPTPTPTVSPSGTSIDTNVTEGLVAGATDNTNQESSNNNLLIIFIVVGAVILAGFVFEIRLKKPEVK